MRNPLLSRTMLNVLFVIVLVVIPLYPWASLPGGGLLSTNNLLTWSVIGVGIIVFIPALYKRELRCSRYTLMLAIGFFLMSIPVIWTPSVFKLSAMYRVGGLLIITVVSWLLWNEPIRGSARIALYNIIIVGGVFQALLAFWQILQPVSAEHYLAYDVLAARGRALGGFRQANLLASFIATALVCSIYRLLTTSVRGIVWKGDVIINALAIIVLGSGLILSESRSMIFIGVFSTVVILLLLKSTIVLRATVIGCFICGLAVGYGVVHAHSSQLLEDKIEHGMARNTAAQLNEKSPALQIGDRRALDRKDSNRERLTMLHGALLMIGEHPLIGSGLGSFERAFPQTLDEHNLPNPFTVTVVHPHNEILFVFAEGGIVALGGLAVWLLIFYQPFANLCVSVRQRLRGEQQGNKISGRYSASRGVIMFPLLAHIMSEYPLQLSVTHIALLLIIIWASLPVLNANKRQTLSSSVSKNMLATLSIFSLAFVGFMITGLQSSSKIRDVESFNFMDVKSIDEIINPYAQPDRINFDRAVSSLMQFNVTQNAYWITNFQHEATRWLANHNDANLIASMFQISKLLNMPKDASYWKLRGCQSFAGDPRFNCEQETKVRNMNHE